MSKGFLVLIIVLGLMAAGAGYLRFGLIPKWNEALYEQQIELERQEQERLELAAALEEEYEASMAALYLEAQATPAASVAAQIDEVIEEASAGAERQQP